MFEFGRAHRASLFLSSTAVAMMASVTPSAGQAVSRQSSDSVNAEAAPADAARDTRRDGTADGTIMVTASRTTRSSVALSGVEMQKTMPGVNPVKAIQTLPGVQFETADPWGNNEQNISLVVHGFNQNQLGFTLDGVPLGDQSYGNFNGLSPQRAVISENVGQVRLSSGAADLGTASASNLGGAVETFTSDPARDLGLRFAQTLGSYDAQRSYLRIDSGEFEGLGGTNSGYVSAVRQKARAWEFDAKQGGYQVNAKFVHKDSHVTLTGYFAYSNKQEPNQDSVAHNAGGIEPYYRSLLYPNFAAALAYLDANGNVPSNAPANYLNYYGDAQRKDYLGYLKLDYRFSDAVTLSNQVYYHHDDGEGQIAGPITVAGLPALFRIYYPGQNLKQVFGDSGYALRTTEYTVDREGLLSRLAIDAGNHAIELGGWYEHNANTVRRRWYAFPVDNPSTPYVRADPALRRLTQYGSDVDVDIVQFHLQDRWRVTPAVTLEAGFKSSLQFANGVVPVQPLPGALSGASTGLPEGKISTKKWFLPAIGGTWDVTSSEQLFANAQKNVRQFQTSVAAGLSPYNLGSQQAFDQLKAQTSPESSWTYEAGIRSHRQVSLGPITAIESQLNYYHVDFSNRLLQISATPVISSVVGGVSILQNVGGVTTNGVDFATTLRFGPHFSLYDALSYNNSKYDDNYTSGTTVVPTAGKYVPNTAKWLNKIVASANDGPFDIQVIGDFVGRRYATYTNDQSVSGRVLLSAQAGYALPPIDGIGLKNLRLSVNVTNLTNRKGIYEVVVGAASKTYNSYATPPRQVFFTLSGAF